MGIQLLGASTGLSASDLVTIPNYTVIGSYFSTTNVSSIDISLTNPSLYRSFHIQCRFDADVNSVPYMRLNNVSSAGTYRSRGDIFYNDTYTKITYGTEENTSFRLAFAASTSNARYAWLDVYNVNSSERKVIKGRMSYTHPTYPGIIEDVYGDANISSAITSINFLPHTGNLRALSATQGIIVYGVK